MFKIGELEYRILLSSTPDYDISSVFPLVDRFLSGEKRR